MRAGREDEVMASPSSPTPSRHAAPPRFTSFASSDAPRHRFGHDACTRDWRGMTELRVRFATDPASVPGARRFVRDGLASWGLAHLSDDVALCVTELAANSALHSAGSFMSVA